MRVIAWRHPCMSENAGDGSSSVGYAQNDVLWFDGLSENWGFEREVGFRGEEGFNALATRLYAVPESEVYKRVYRMLWRLLSQSRMQKITLGRPSPRRQLRGFSNMEANNGKDIEPGTFADLLRYGTHFPQKGDQIRNVKSEKPADTLRTGLLEPRWVP
ncbi:hypothetical protein ATEIFO6365_0001026000 [Aspergillus terreus]|uniref:Uncharacterized protein n=1 Tax=Aspergillus terreus TaxID=33178 RepID=A0A5M3Z2Z5_ASPTE|nr:hypothetical protein ATETN484_0006037300 [Aspergillus terreus]GFF12037.1 hypothetical protein ATEIFO6365_0001026000 [Aspergillus terreus]